MAGRQRSPPVSLWSQALDRLTQPLADSPADQRERAGAMFTKTKNTLRRDRPASVRKWLRDEASSALPALRADGILKDMVSELIALEKADDDKSIEKGLVEVRGHIAKVVIDYLRRARVYSPRVDADVSLDGGKVHCILTMTAYNRAAHIYLEF
jgi:hypothetical protein